MSSGLSYTSSSDDGIWQTTRTVDGLVSGGFDTKAVTAARQGNYVTAAGFFVAGTAVVFASLIPGGEEGRAAESAATLLPDFSGWGLKQIEEHLGNAGFSERQLVEGSTSTYRTFDHADGSKVSLDMVNNVAKVNGPKQWAADMSRKFPPRIGRHNQPFIP